MKEISSFRVITSKMMVSFSPPGWWCLRNFCLHLLFLLRLWVVFRLTSSACSSTFWERSLMTLGTCGHTSSSLDWSILLWSLLINPLALGDLHFNSCTEKNQATYYMPCTRTRIYAEVLIPIIAEKMSTINLFY